MRLKIFGSLLLLLVSIPALAQSPSPISLDECIRIGLENNQSLRINRFETDRSVSQAKSNISMILPKVDFSLSAGSSGILSPEYGIGQDTLTVISGQGDIIFSTPEATGEYGDRIWHDGSSMSFNLTQNIWDGGVWWNTLKTAKIAKDVADIEFTRQELNTIHEVKVAFYNYLSKIKLLDVYSENLTTSNYQHQLTLERFKLGAASQNDTLRTRVNIEQSRMNIINGKIEVQSKTRELNIILGREWDSPLQLQEPVWEMIEIPNINGAMDEVLHNNPNLKLLDRNSEVKAYDVKIARAGYVPSLGLSVSYSNEAFELGNVFDGNTATLSSGLGLSWNLFNGTSTKRKVEQSKITAKIATENYDLAKRNVRNELARILESMEALKESVKISQLILTASEQDLLLAQEQYKIGSLSILDVLRITDSYEDAKSNLIRTQYNLKIAEAGLLQLMGKR